MKNHNLRYYIKFFSINTGNWLNVNAKSIYAQTPEKAVEILKKVVAENYGKFVVEVLKVSEIPIDMQSFEIFIKIKINKHSEKELSVKIKEETEADAKIQLERIIKNWKTPVEKYEILYIK